MLKKLGAWVRGVRLDMNKELKLLLHVRLQQKKKMGGGDAVQWLGGGQSGCERRIEVVKMQNEKKVGVGSSLGGGGG